MATENPPPAPAKPVAPAAPQQQPEIPDVEILAWSAAIMASHERSQRWYLVAGLVFLVFVIGSIIQGSWSFTIVLMLLGGVYFLVHRKPSPMKTISIRTKSVVFDGDVIPWSDCTGFWFLPGTGYTELHIELPRRRDIVIHTGPVNMQDLRAILTTVLPELTNRRERLLDKIIRICKL